MAASESYTGSETENHEEIRWEPFKPDTMARYRLTSLSNKQVVQYCHSPIIVFSGKTLFSRKYFKIIPPSINITMVGWENLLFPSTSRIDPYPLLSSPTYMISQRSVADLHPGPACHFDADPDHTGHFDADPDSNPGLQIKAQHLEKVLK